VIPLGGNVVTKDIRRVVLYYSGMLNSLRSSNDLPWVILLPKTRFFQYRISGREPKEISFRSLAYINPVKNGRDYDFINFEIQNSGYADKLAAGVVITGGGAMLRHLPQLMKFKTAMDVRIGYPNEHLAGDGRDEINQPVYATAVGLVMRGYEYLETYKKSFNAGPQNEYFRQVPPETFERITEEVDDKGGKDDYPQEPRTSIAEKIKMMMSKMFEVEDQSIN
jgi:cell division protein FtsA